MSANVKRLVLWSILGSLLLLGLATLFWPRATAVDLATIEPLGLRLTIDEEGETRLRNTYTLSAPVTGHMARIAANVGDSLVANETRLAFIEPIEPSLLDVRTRAQANAAVASAIAAESLSTARLAQADADVEFTSAELDRARRLRADNIIPIRELDIANREWKLAQAEFDTAVAALAVSQSDLEQARALLRSPAEFAEANTGRENVEVHAPIDGQIMQIFRRHEGIVTAGEALLEFGDTSQLEIVADLLSTDAVGVSRGQRVLIDAWGGMGELEGVVRRVEPFAFTKVSSLGIEEKRVNVVIDILSDTDAYKGLGHGYQLDVHIVMEDINEALTVPLTSLFRTGDEWSLFVAADGRAIQRIISLGRRNSFYAEVVEGLQVGERILRYPNDTISDGKRIIEREPS